MEPRRTLLVSATVVLGILILLFLGGNFVLSNPHIFDYEVYEDNGTTAISQLYLRV